MKYWKHFGQHNSEQGLTLVEVLVATVVLSVVLAAIVPMMSLAIASRYKAQRSEQAFRIAQAQIDKVQLALQSGDLDKVDLDKQIPPASTATEPRLVPAPSSATSDSSCNEYLIAESGTATSWCSVDLNGDGTPELGIQTFRVGTQTRPSPSDTSVNVPVAFQLGVRVYRTESLAQPSQLAQQPDITIADLGITTGSRDTSSSDTSTPKKLQPLAILYTSIARGDLRDSLGAYCQLKGGTGCPN
jgi:prepilin-type N-terminal cleavage/methylation domain-containing protein